MVAFTDVRTFLRKSSTDPTIKSRLKRFIHGLQTGKLTIHGLNPDDIQQLFEVKECGLNLVFLAIIDMVEGRPRDILTCLQTFDEDDFSLEDIHELIEQFLSYQYDHRLFPTEAEAEPLIRVNGRIRVAFILAQDHEGTMPMLVYSRDLHPTVAAMLVRGTMLCFFANGPTHYQPVD